MTAPIEEPPPCGITPTTPIAQVIEADNFMDAEDRPRKVKIPQEADIIDIDAFPECAFDQVPIEVKDELDEEVEVLKEVKVIKDEPAEDDELWPISNTLDNPFVVDSDEEVEMLEHDVEQQIQAPTQEPASRNSPFPVHDAAGRESSDMDVDEEHGLPLASSISEESVNLTRHEIQNDQMQNDATPTIATGLGSSLLGVRKPRMAPEYREKLREAQKRAKALQDQASSSSSGPVKHAKQPKQKEAERLQANLDDGVGVEDKLDPEEVARRREYRKQRDVLLQQTQGAKFSIEASIELQRLDTAEMSRRRMLLEDVLYSKNVEQEEEEEEDGLFVNEQPKNKLPVDDDIVMQDAPGTSGGKAASGNVESKEETLTKKKSKLSGQQAKTQKKLSGRGKGRPSKNATIQGGPSSSAQISKITKGRKKQARLPKTAQQLSNMGSLFTANLFTDAQGNAGGADQPAFESGKISKAHALRSLIASLPAAEQGPARSDRMLLDDATKHFKGKGNSVRPKAGSDEWEVFGLKASLKHYQMIGASFMRQRERCGEGDGPKGGIIADQMGLGKTVMMLANIVNDKPKSIKRSERLPTLIVASHALANQWSSEIKKHCDPEYIGNVVKMFGGGKGLIASEEGEAEILSGQCVVYGCRFLP